MLVTSLVLIFHLCIKILISVTLGQLSAFTSVNCEPGNNTISKSVIIYWLYSSHLQKEKLFFLSCR